MSVNKVLSKQGESPWGKEKKERSNSHKPETEAACIPVEQHFLSFNLTELISLRLRKSLALFPDQINTGNSSANLPVIRMALCNLEGRRQRKSQKIKDIILALLRSILWTAAVIWTFCFHFLLIPSSPQPYLLTSSTHNKVMCLATCCWKTALIKHWIGISAYSFIHCGAKQYS